MANKRILKRNINEMVFDVVEECFFFEMTAPSKSDKSAQLIDEAADFQDAKIVIKGCSKESVPTDAYLKITQLLQPVAKSLFYGEPCSTVPLYKRKS